MGLGGLSTQEIKADTSEIQGHFGIHRQLAGLDYMTPFLKKKKILNIDKIYFWKMKTMLFLLLPFRHWRKHPSHLCKLCYFKKESSYFLTWHHPSNSHFEKTLLELFSEVLTRVKIHVYIHSLLDCWRSLGRGEVLDARLGYERWVQKCNWTPCPPFPM